MDLIQDFSSETWYEKNTNYYNYKIPKKTVPRLKIKYCVSRNIQTLSCLSHVTRLGRKEKEAKSLTR